MREVWEDLEYSLISDETQTSSSKLLIYSGHDTTILPFLCALEIYEGIWPPYASYVSLEFARSVHSKQLFVRAIYNDCEMKLLGSNSYWCPYDRVRERISKLAITEIEYSRGSQLQAPKSRL